MPAVGYDYFTASPGVTNEVRCKVCGAMCHVTRNLFGPTSFVAAVARVFRHHDAFACPNTSQPWHERALRLVQAIEDTPSPRLAAIMKEDLHELLAAQSPAECNKSQSCSSG